MQTVTAYKVPSGIFATPEEAKMAERKRIAGIFLEDKVGKGSLYTDYNKYQAMTYLAEYYDDIYRLFKEYGID